MADEQEWRTAWTGAVGTDRQSIAVLESLLERHREPLRRYHGVHHVVWVLRHIHALAGEHQPTDIGAITVAACFHDAVYDPRRDDNEAASAELARRELAELGWSAARCADVARMIRATADHVPPRADATDGGPSVLHATAGGPAGIDAAAGDAAAQRSRGAEVGRTKGESDVDAGVNVDLDVSILLDADLAVLGADAAAYQAYVTGVRTEYGHIDNAGWRSGRLDVLRALLARDEIYRTPAARRWWETRARANLTAELATLG